MRMQIETARFLWQHQPSRALKDRYDELKANQGLNTPAQTGELFAIQAILRGRTKRSRKSTH